jgi:hypothetical protein
MQAALRTLAFQPALLLAICCALATFRVAAIEPLAPTLMPADGPRLRVFISDMHVGLGHISLDPNSGTWTAGPWHPMEDFRWDEDFDRFLTEIETRSERAKIPVDLIILGDFLELWQTPWSQMDCIYDADGKPVPPEEILSPKVLKDLSCTEVDALKRTARVLGAHATVLARLKTFAELGDNSVTIVPGNHDAALAFKSVAQRVTDAIGAANNRVVIGGAGYWLSADGLIFAEHGHFIPGDVNDYKRFPASCLDTRKNVVGCNGGTGGVFLQRPWGEQFVQRYYNQYEEKFPIIDNITSELYGVKIAVKEVGPLATADAISDGFKFLLLGESGSQFVRLLGRDQEGPGMKDMLGDTAAQPGWNIAETRKMGDRFLVESLDINDPVRAAAERALAAGQLGLTINDLRDDEIKQLCDVRAAQHRLAVAPGGSGASVTLCPGGATLGAVVTSLFQTGAVRKSERLEQIWTTLPATARPTKDFAAYIYAHTHSPHGACKPREVAGARPIVADGPPVSWNPIALNTGAWQRLVSPERLAEMRKSDQTKKLADYVPEELPACYSVIVVPAYDAKHGEKPEPALYFWAVDPKVSKWRLLPSCPKDAWRLPKDACAG